MNFESVLIAGFARDFERTIPLLIRWLRESRNASGRSAPIHLILLAATTAHRREILETLPTLVEPHARVESLEVFTETQFRVEVLELKRNCLQAGDPWPSTHGRALERHLYLLKTLDEAQKLVGPKLGTALYLRADLYPKGVLRPPGRSHYSTWDVLVPSWHSWGGFNDRVAVVKPNASKPYFTRYREVGSFVQSIGPLHAETFLKHCLRQFDVKKSIGNRFVRARGNGVQASESFIVSPARSQIGKALRMRKQEKGKK